MYCINLNRNQTDLDIDSKNVPYIAQTMPGMAPWSTLTAFPGVPAELMVLNTVQAHPHICTTEGVLHTRTKFFICLAAVPGTLTRGANNKRPPGPHEERGVVRGRGQKIV